MASIIQYVEDYYEWTLTLADPRTKGWLLVDNMKPIFWLIVSYLCIVWTGPKIMKK